MTERVSCWTDSFVVNRGELMDTGRNDRKGVLLIRQFCSEPRWTNGYREKWQRGCLADVVQAQEHGGTTDDSSVPGGGGGAHGFGQDPEWGERCHGPSAAHCCSVCLGQLTRDQVRAVSCWPSVFRPGVGESENWDGVGGCCALNRIIVKRGVLC